MVDVVVSRATKVVLGLILAGCGVGPFGTATMPEEVGRSGGRQCGEQSVDAIAFVSRTQRWLAVDSERSIEIDPNDDRGATQVHRLVVRGPGIEKPTEVDVEIHGSLLWGLDWAADHGGDFYIGVGGGHQVGGPAEHASVAVVLTPDEGAFAGRCSNRYTEYFKEQFGDRWPDIMREAVSLTGDDIAQLFDEAQD